MRRRKASIIVGLCLLLLALGASSAQAVLSSKIELFYQGTASNVQVRLGEPVWMGDWEYNKPSIVFETSGGKIECGYGSEGDGLFGQVVSNPQRPTGALVMTFNYGTGILGGNPYNYCSSNMRGPGGINLGGVKSIETSGFPWTFTLMPNGTATLGSPGAIVTVNFAGGGIFGALPETCHYSPIGPFTGTQPVTPGGVAFWPEVVFSNQLMQIEYGSGPACPTVNAQLSFKFYGIESYGNQLRWTVLKKHP